MTPDAPDRATREPSAAGRRLVLVVQGIGDEAAGATVGALARSIEAETGRARIPTAEVLWLTEGSGRQIQEEAFPCHVERLPADRWETVLAEVYWADLSRPGHKALDLLLAIPKVLFGLHLMAARHAADPSRQGQTSEPAAEALQKLSRVIAHLVRGPAAAAALLFAILSAISVAALIVRHDATDPQGGWVAGIFLAANLVACTVGAWGFRRRRGGPFRALFLWLGLLGAAGLVYWLTGLAFFRTSVGEARLGESWLFSALLTDYPLFLAFILIALATLPWLVARMRAQPARRPGIDAAQAVNVGVLGLWVLLVQFLYLAIYTRLPEAAPEARELAGGMSTGMALYSILALLPIGSLLVTLVQQRRWAGRTLATSYLPSRAAPRLVLGQGILFALILLPLLLLAIFFVPGLGAWLGAALGGAEQIVIAIVVLVGFVAIYASEEARTALDFGLDIVGYFETERSPDDGELVFARRERFHRRMRIVAEALVRREKPDQVTVLAHSLGTMVAIETLADERIEALLEPLAQADLVTMASPFHHLFQHYLCNEYPPLGDERWDGLRRRVDRWINIFRIDDYVGTGIEPGGDWPENRPVDPGGHTNYWSDRQVLRILHERQLV